ncbi:uncharacterized protein LOC115819628 [Chanos chanos]|uniref:Uncharacterized protein LOC115819628 n=1 Tax=Chanos chanos TaxID=29144 RepID=A0A6J2W4G3_CHACN|nr:uncharacterized protein LOC115819628 [Chanos chanos]
MLVDTRMLERGGVIRIIKRYYRRKWQARALMIVVAILSLCCVGLIFALVFHSHFKHLPDAVRKENGESVALKQNGEHSEQALSNSLARHPNKPLVSAYRTVQNCNDLANNSFLPWDKFENDQLITYDNKTRSLIMPHSGMYHVSVQVAYRYLDGFRCEGTAVLRQKVLRVSDSYPRPVTLLTAEDTVNCNLDYWSKTLYTGAILHLDKEDRLSVNISRTELVDCGGKLHTKTFFSLYLVSMD